MAKKNDKSLQTLIESIKALYKRIDEAAQSDEFSAFVEGIKETFSFIGTLIIPLKEVMPFVLAEMKEKGITFEELNDDPKKQEHWREIVKGATERAKSYQQAKRILAAESLTIKQALTLKVEAEDVAAAIVTKEERGDTEKKVVRNMFMIDYVRNPLKAIEKWRTKENRDIWDTILDEERRKQEENKADQKEREEIILNSRYASAWKLLKIDEKKGLSALLADMAIIYFSATLPKDAPGIIEPGELTEQEAQEVKEAYKRIKAFEKKNPLKEQGEISFLLAFVKAENPAAGKLAVSKKRIKEIQEEIKQYSPHLQNKVSNALAHISSRKFKPIPHTNIEEAEHGGVRVQREIGRLPFSSQELKVLDAFISAFTSNMPNEERFNYARIDKAREVELTIQWYMKLRGLNDPKKARKQLNAAVDAIYDNSVLYKETPLTKDSNGKIKKESERLWKIRIIDAEGIESGKPAVKNNKVIVKLSFDFAKYLASSSLMQYPNALYKINDRKNPHSYFMGRKLAEIAKENYFKSNKNLISVQKLVEACPDLPLYEEIIEGAGQVRKRIIVPIERDLKALKDYGIINDFGFCNSTGEDITDEQRQKYDYESWLKLIVKFNMAGYPEINKKKIEPKNRGCVR